MFAPDMCSWGWRREDYVNKRWLRHSVLPTPFDHADTAWWLPSKLFRQVLFNCVYYVCVHMRSLVCANVFIYVLHTHTPNSRNRKHGYVVAYPGSNDKNISFALLLVLTFCIVQPPHHERYSSIQLSLVAISEFLANWGGRRVRRRYGVVCRENSQWRIIAIGL